MMMMTMMMRDEMIGLQTGWNGSWKWRACASRGANKSLEMKFENVCQEREEERRSGGTVSFSDTVQYRVQ